MTRKISTESVINWIRLKLQSSFTTPTAGYGYLGSKTDKKLYWKDEDGTETNLTDKMEGPGSATDNAVTRYDSTTGKLVQNSSATIDDSGTVNIPTGQTYNINGSAHTHSYAPNSFATISVPGQSDVVADSTADTLTLAAGSNITITTNAGTDTVTIAASGGGGNVATDTIWDAKGDLVVGTGADTSAKLTVGANGTVLVADSTQTTGVKWDTVAGTGDVVGPGSSTDNAITRFDSTTGKLLQNSSATVDDSGTVNIPTGQTYNINSVSIIDDTAYDATTWNGDTTHAPSKNAVRDKIESMGGGGGAPTTANYVTTAADGTLSAEKVLPYLANYNPDIAPSSPSASNDEFDDDTIDAAWTQINSPDSISESTYHGFVTWTDNDTQTAGVGLRKSFSPGASTAFTVVISLSYFLPVSFSSAWLAVETSAPANIATLGLQNAGNGFSRFRVINGATETNPGTIGGMYMGHSSYLAIQRDASNNYLLRFSNDGVVWSTEGSFSNSGTVANVSILLDSQGGGTTDSSVSVDFIRFFTSATNVIGAAP